MLKESYKSAECLLFPPLLLFLAKIIESSLVLRGLQAQLIFQTNVDHTETTYRSATTAQPSHYRLRLAL